MSETQQARPDAVAGQVDRGVRPHAIRLASQLQSAAYSHGYEDGHPSNATTRQDKYSAASQRLLSELREAIELLIAERDQARAEVERQKCQINGLMFDALGEPRTRHVRVTLDGNNCVMTPVDGDRYVQDARDAGDDTDYEVADVYLSDREFEDLPEHDGF